MIFCERYYFQRITVASNKRPSHEINNNQNNKRTKFGNNQNIYYRINSGLF